MTEGGPLLALDAAPGIASIALVRSGVLVDARALAMRRAPDAGDRRDTPFADEPLMLAVADILRTAGVRAMDLTHIVCGAGPGGFTSLRIAAALAKGIAHASGAVLQAAPSLAWAAAVRAPHVGSWLVTLDALRGEHYVARVELASGAEDDGRPTPLVRKYRYLGVHATASLPALADDVGVDGTLAVDASLDAAPIAAGVLACPALSVDLAQWEPDYGRLAEAQARWEAAHGPLPAQLVSEVV